MRSRLLVAAAGLTGLLAAAPSSSAPEERIRIPQVATSFSGRDVRVEARLSRALPEEVVRRLGSGLPTTATWEALLQVSRRKWFDGAVDERRYEVTATYRPLSGDFTVERRLDGRLLETSVVPTREEALRALATLPGLPFFSMSPELANRPLVVRLRCLYASRLALGVFPTRVGTSWRSSPRFRWKEPGGTP